MIPRRTALASTAALAALGAFALAPAASAAPSIGVEVEPTSLADVLAADGQEFDDNGSDFDVLDAAVAAVLAEKPDSPLAILADGEEPLTAFLPEDNGFKSFAYELDDSSGYPDEQEAFDIVATVGIDAIERILLFHVIPGSTLDYRDLALSANSIFGTAADGQILTITVQGFQNEPPERKAVVVNDGTDYFGQALTVRNINEGNPQIAHSIVLDILRPTPLVEE